MERARDDRLLALLLLLPSTLLVGPWQALGGELDPLPLAAFAGIALLAFLPAAVALVVAGVRPRLPDFALYAIALAVAVAGVAWTDATDTFERDVRLCTLLVFGAGLLGGASLSRHGTRWVVHGLAALSLIALVPALVAAWASGDPALLAGATGNTGTLAQVALPGAASGLVLGADRRAALASRLLGGAAFVAAVVHAGEAPVLTALVLLIAAVLVSVVRALALAAARPSPTEPDAVASSVSLPMVGAALLAVALVAAPHASRVLAPDVAGDGAAVASGDLGGAGARAAIWQRTMRMIADRPLTGVGAGQFQASFPEYRSAQEIASSTAGRRTAHETEVEHPHDEPLLALAELGLVGGLAWIALLVVAGIAAGGAALFGLTPRATLGFAGAVLLGMAVVHAPLSANAASAPLAGVLFGALLTRAEDRAPLPLRALRPWAFLAAIALLAPAAISLARHGLALAERQRLARDAALDPAATDPARAERALEDALDARPDSPTALALAARLALSRGERGRAAELDAALLALRPHQIEALVRTGLVALLEGHSDAARDAWMRVRELDDAHPAACWNLARLFLERLEPAGAHEPLAALQTAGADLTPALDLVADAQRGGWAPPERLAELLQDVPPFAGGVPLPEALFAASRAWAESDDEPLVRRAAGLESLAHHLWAHAHRATGDAETERRSLRQSWSASRRGDAPGSPLVALELAAVEAELGALDRAREILTTTLPTDRARRWLAAEQVRRLEEAGLLAPR